MSENLKRVSESIDAVRDRIQKIEDMAADGAAHPEAQFAGAAEHLDILLAQIADELRRGVRRPYPRGVLVDLAKLIEGKLQ